MYPIVVIDAHTGSLTRYLAQGQKVERTHGCTLGERCGFSAKIVEGFRVNPDPRFGNDNGGDVA